MGEGLKASAWALGLWGALSIIFGVVIVAWPAITLKALLVVLAIYLLASGAVTLIGSVIDRGGHWVVGIVLGALSILAGLYIFSNPQVSALVVLYLVAIWSIAVGALVMVAGFEVERDGIWLVLAGIAGMLFGFYIFANPGDGALTLVWLISIYTIVTGVLMAIGAFRLHSAGVQLQKAAK